MRYPPNAHLVRTLILPFPEVRIYEAPDLPGEWIAENSRTGDVTQGHSPQHAFSMYGEMMRTLRSLRERSNR